MDSRTEKSNMLIDRQDTQRITIGFGSHVLLDASPLTLSRKHLSGMEFDIRVIRPNTLGDLVERPGQPVGLAFKYRNARKDNVPVGPVWTAPESSR